MTVEYEPIWNGATWRDFPQPVMADGHPPMEAHFERQPLATILRAVLSYDWQTVEAVRTAAFQAGFPSRRFGEYLSRLVKDGRVEMRRDEPRCRSRRSYRLIPQLTKAQPTPESRILAVLDHPMGPLAIRALAQMSIPPLRPALKRLERMGVIERCYAPPVGRGRRALLYRRVQATQEAA